MATFGERLREAGQGKSPAASTLTFLSDMSGEDRATFREVWPTFATERRRLIVRRLATIAEDNIELDFRYAFLTALEDADPKVRKSAVEGLYEDESKRLLLKLLDMLRHDPDEDTREAVALALSRFTLLAQCNKLGPEAEKLRDTLLESARDPREKVLVNRRTIEALGYYHEDPDAQALIGEAYEKGDRHAESAVLAMGRSMDDRWRTVVRDELESTYPAMRYEAAHAAGEMVLEEARPTLIQMLDDPDTEVRLAAIWALGQIGGKPATDALAGVLKSEEPAMREAAQEALAEIAFAADPLNISS